MKRKLSSGLVLCASVLANAPLQAQTYDWATPSPYVGLDAQVRYMPFKENFGKNLFKKYSPQGNIYGGLRLHENFGVELGYELNKKKSKTTDVHQGDGQLGGVVNPDPDVETYISKVKIKGWHFDLVGYYPVNLYGECQTDLIASVGLGVKTLTADNDWSAYNGVPNTAAFRAAQYRSFKKRKTTFRLAAGVQQLVTENFGVRALVGWENTGRFKAIKSIQSPNGSSSISLKNTFQYSLGVYLTF